jgi:branched-chain amino acid transport system ATP-binding protein
MLRTEALTAGYGRLEVLRGVDITLTPGRTLVVLGPNGAGKTTLCLALSAVVPIRSGRLLVDGTDLAASAPMERVRRGIVQVPEGRQVFPRMTVEENLRLGAFVHGQPKRGELDVVYDLFPILRTRRDTHAGLLSGGEQQMLALARALMTRPRYLILDEPSQGLSPVVVDQMIDALRDIAVRGIALLLVEQNIGLAEALADDVVFLEDGRSRAGSPEDIVSAGAVAASYLGTVDPAGTAQGSPDAR